MGLNLRTSRSRHLPNMNWHSVLGLVNGCVIPALQSFIADSYMDGVRGTGFGFLNLVGTVGGIGGGAIATVMAGHYFLGIPGWRLAFIVTAILSCLIAFLVYTFVDDPRKRTADYDSTRVSSRDELAGWGRRRNS